METKQVTYLCKKTYIEQGKALFIKDKMYVGNGNHITGECSVIYLDDTSIKKYFEEAKTPILIEGSDRVNHPSHYTWLKEKCGIEVIDITRHMDFDCGNAVKYILRAGHKSEEGYSNKEKQIEDFKKAIFYLNDKIKMLEKDL